ncbi:MAG: type I restriction endonuclease subunit R, partial [Thermoguttaceae bacterium]
MLKHEIIVETPEYTVASSYEPKYEGVDYAAMTEGALEDAFLRILLDQGYELADFHSEKELVENLRRQLERLNDFKFSDDEWESFFKEYLANPQQGIQDKTRLLQNGRALVDFCCEDGSVRNLYLFDKDQVHANRLQVMRQFCAEGKKRDRYDVTILVNGLPMVHVELKRAGGRLKEAFNQIERYQTESFSEGFALFEFVQIFVISTGVETKYYSNTTRKLAVADRAGVQKKSSASFEFTSYWADARNNVVHNLFDFAKTFFGRAAILNILAKYCVFTVDENLLVMRPYQICAAERIVQKIRAAAYAKEWSGISGGGYVWHTTGSGKTLTSFKTAQLAAQIPDVDQVVFVVDRKDLDYQTMREYERFQKGAAVGTTSSNELGKLLNSRDSSQKIVVTTIQKLSAFCDSATRDSVAAAKKFVFIFDECHRSQFGLMRDAIDAYFKKRLLYGFTGTPIFKENAAPLAAVSKPRKYRGANSLAVTTEQSFGERLHVYNIVDAIRDHNVLKFHVDFHDVASDMERELKERELVLDDPETRASLYVNNAVEHILKTYDAKTMRSAATYPFRTTRVTLGYLKRREKAVYDESQLRGFNALLAVSDIHAAIRYYKTFKEKLGPRFGTEFKIGVIFSASKNENTDAALGYLDDAAKNWIDDENNESAAGLGSEEFDFLESAIQDYNKLFNVSYSAGDGSFANYYKDVSMRMKNRELDLLIVVNMFLTGFDAPTLNTLWCDKNLRYHGLLQAFSRTNRILNAAKSQGNIVCLRDLREEV